MPLEKPEILPLGAGRFSSLVESGAAFVDKTDLAGELAQESAFYFLARPPRFGKSLLLSAFASLFADGLRHFKGLKIESLWRDAAYRSVLLDFDAAGECESFSAFQAAFEGALTPALAKAGFVRDASKTLADDVGRWMLTLPPRSLVLLIDNVDAPLWGALARSAVLYDDIERFLGRFFLTIKSYAGCLRFFFMTGVAGLPRQSVFSDFNCVTDLSFEPRCGALLGFTAKEIASSFPQHWQATRASLGLSDEALLRVLKAVAGGYVFDLRASVEVFSPEAVLRFLACPQTAPEAKVLENGLFANLISRHLMQTNFPVMTSGDRGEPVLFEERFAFESFESLHPAVMLAQAGCYAIRKSTGRVLTLGFPNPVVRQAAARRFFRHPPLPKGRGL